MAKLLRRSLGPLIITLAPGKHRYLEHLKRVRQELAKELGEAIDEFGPQIWEDFDKVSLADVIAQLNRFRRGRIVIADADLARRSVSGVFEIANLNAALATIARELGLRTAALPPFVTVLY